MRPLGWLLTAALAVRLAFVFVLAPLAGLDDSLVIDSDGYLETAEYINEGKYFFENNVISTRRMPLYPSILAMFSWLPVPLVPLAKAWQILLDCCTVACAYLFARKFFGPAAAWLAGALYAAYPLALYRLMLMNTEVIQTAAVAFFALAAVRVFEERSVRSALLASALAVVVLNINPAFVLFPGLLSLTFFLRMDFRTALKLAACVVLPIACFSVLWGARNAYISGSFYFFDTRGGKEFWIGNHQGAEGRWEGPLRHIWENELEEHMRIMRERGLDVSDYNAYFYGIAMEEIQRDPLGALELLGKKFIRFWYIPASETMTSVTIPLQSFYLGLALIGWAGYRKINMASMMPLGLTAYFCAIYTLSYACIRFSHSVMPWICVMGGLGLAYLYHRFFSGGLENG